MGFSRQEYWSGLPFPPPADPSDPGSNPPTSPIALALQAPLRHQRSPTRHDQGLPQRLSGKESTFSARDTGSGRSLGGGHGNCILAWRIPWTEGWRATVHKVTKSWDYSDISDNASSWIAPFCSLLFFSKLFSFFLYFVMYSIMFIFMVCVSPNRI